MSRFLTALITALLLLAATQSTAHAVDDYLVPITVGGKTYTLTVTIESGGIAVSTDAKTVTIGKVMAVPPLVDLAAQQDLEARKAAAVTIAYADLFRHNEDHIGKTVRYAGKVVEVQENVCILCENPGYHLRVEVTKGSYDLWGDPIWVEYMGTERFLEDDIVTVWGVVDGLKKYIAVLSNQITLPQITAFEVQLGEIANPQPGAAAAPGAPIANRDANLRGGPGTGYVVVGGVDAGDALTIVARNSAGDWFQLADEAWLAAFLVDNAPAIVDLPVVEGPALPAASLAATVTATPQAQSTTAESTTAEPAAPAEPAAQPETAATGSSSILAVGQEIEANGWRFKVSELHKRKAVYFYSDAHIAMGHFLVVIIDATNLQSGTDYFDRNIDPWVTDAAGKVYSTSGTASGYAGWQYGGISSLFTNVDPGDFVRIAFAVDLPDDTGNVLLSTDVGKWVALGNFAAMPTEDN